jgi:hypothetical protein
MFLPVACACLSLVPASSVFLPHALVSLLFPELVNALAKMY